MSRIGKLPVVIPDGVSVSLRPGNELHIKGPKGELTRKLAGELTIDVKDGKITVDRPNDIKRFKALHGLTRSLINNMVVGVTAGYSKLLEINGTGYRAVKSGNKLTLTLGYSHPIEMIDPEGVTSTVEGVNRITVSGVNKEHVGQYAADIRGKRPPEPYNGKGIKYSDERIRRKAGKAGKK